MNHTLRSTIEEELQKAYERGVQDGMKREHAMWQLAKIGQEIEHVQAVNMSEECVQKTEKNEHEWVGLTDEEKTYLTWESNNGSHCVAMTEALLKEKNI